MEKIILHTNFDERISESEILNTNDKDRKMYSINYRYCNDVDYFI